MWGGAEEMKSERDQEACAMWYIEGGPESFGLLTAGFPLFVEVRAAVMSRKSCTESAWLAVWKYFWLSGLRMRFSMGVE